MPVEQYMYNETRFRMLTQSDEARAETLLKLASQDAKVTVELLLTAGSHALRWDHGTEMNRDWD